MNVIDQIETAVESLTTIVTDNRKVINDLVDVAKRNLLLIKEMEERVKKLEFMVEKGLSWEDMKDDTIKQP